MRQTVAKRTIRNKLCLSQRVNFITKSKKRQDSLWKKWEDKKLVNFHYILRKQYSALRNNSPPAKKKQIQYWYCNNAKHVEIIARFKTRISYVRYFVALNGRCEFILFRTLFFMCNLLNAKHNTVRTIREKKQWLSSANN